MLRLTALILLSLLIHVILYEGVWLLPNKAQPLSSDVQIDVLENKPRPQADKTFDKPVVKSSDAPESKDLSDPAKFIAEKNQRFEKQTRATKLGAFENHQVTKKSPASEQNDVPEFARSVQQQIARTQESTVPYELPSEIQSGSATNLNADAHIYASFYNRILNLFYVRWAERLNSIFARLPTDVYKKLAGKSWTTEVEIWLDQTGLYQEGLIMQSSGFKPFDEAGIYAFQNARFFPNPPRAKVEEDGGRVRLRYRIRVVVY